MLNFVAKPKAVITVDDAHASDASLTLEGNVHEALKIIKHKEPEAATVEIVFVASQLPKNGLATKHTNPKAVDLEEVC